MSSQVWIDVLLRAGAGVELCHVVEKGKTVKKKPSAKKNADSSKNRKGKKKMVDSDSEHDVVAGSEDELGASPSHWKIDTGSMSKVNQNELPTFTIKTRLGSKSTAHPSHEPMDTDNELDELDSSPSKTNIGPQSRGTKRKAEHDPPPSPTPRSLSRSSSRKMVPEVLIMIPSPKMKRIAQSSDSSV
jgi:hypothetical protein